jgi:hypothetical protein
MPIQPLGDLRSPLWGPVAVVSSLGGAQQSLESRGGASRGGRGDAGELWWGGWDSAELSRAWEPRRRQSLVSRRSSPRVRAGSPAFDGSQGWRASLIWRAREGGAKGAWREACRLSWSARSPSRTCKIATLNDPLGFLCVFRAPLLRPPSPVDPQQPRRLRCLRPRTAAGEI